MHIIKSICHKFEERNIKYCHFKSNQHLDESFNGDTDFDILIDHNKKTEVDIVLSQFDCKRFTPVGIGIYPGVEDWYAFDPVTGKMFHIHLHYQLATGKQYVKEYILPWNEIVLNNAVKDEKYNIYISHPNVEIILLITRMIVKSKLRDSIKAKIGLYNTHSSLQTEYEYLKNKIDIEDLNNYLSSMYSPKEAILLLEIINNNIITSQNFKKLSKIVRKSFRDDKRMGSLKAFSLANFYKLFRIYRRIERKLGKFNMFRKATVSGGKIICFIGVDGSGKSTLTTEINRWLRKGKVENTKVYMGSGDGKKSLFPKIIGTMRKKQQKRKNMKTQSLGDNKPKKENISILFTKDPLKYIKNYIKALEMYSIAKSNRKKIIKMHAYRLNGGVSIVDRYPQLEQVGINDGLKLKEYADKLNSKILRRLAIREKNILQIVNDIYPDFVFRLNISAEVSLQRKPDENTDYDYFNKKAQLVKALKYSNSVLYDIDAEKDYDKVLLEIKKIIWNNF